MDKLTRYLIDNAEALIGNPIRPTEEVLAREDAPLFIWHKMGMTHELMCEKDPMGGTGWKTLAPAAHMYVFNEKELENITPFLNKAYIELREAVGSMGNDLWYLLKESDGWHLRRGVDDFGTVDTECEEVEYAADADAALSNLMIHFLKDYPKMCMLSECIVLPYGCCNQSVWEHASKVTLLGKEEANDFVMNVVMAHAEGAETKKIIPKW